MRIRWMVAMVTCVTAAVLPGTAPAQGSWTTHIDASLINEIVARDGKLYCASRGGLLVYDPATDRFEQFTNVDGLLSNSLTALVFDAAGKLYVGTEDIGIARFSVATGAIRRERVYTQQIEGIADNHVTSLAIDGDDVVYGSIDGMGLIVDDFPSSPLKKSDGLPDEKVNDVMPLGGFVWAATDSGMVRLDQFGLLQPAPGGSAPGDAIALATDGVRTFAGTSDGVWQYDPGPDSWTRLGLDGVRVDAVLHDGSALWSTTRVKVHRYNGASWSFAQLSEVSLRYDLDFASARVPGLAVTGPDQAYASITVPSAGRGAGLISVDARGVPLDSAIVAERLARGPGGSSVSRLSFDPIEEALWATFNFYYVGKLMRDDNWLNYNASIPEADSLSSLFFNIVCLADSRGHKWFGSFDAPLDRLDDRRDADYSNDSWQHIALGEGNGDGLGSNRLVRAREDPEGNIWFLSDNDVVGMNGIHIYNPVQDEWLQVTTSTHPGIGSGNVVDVGFASEIAYVVLKESVKLWLTNGYRWSELQSANLPDDWADGPSVGVELDRNTFTGANQLFGAAVRSDDNVWVASDNGVFEVAVQSKVAHIPAFTGIAAGLLSPLATSVVLDHDENLWVATQAGLNRVDRDDPGIIDAWSTRAEYQRTLADLRYPLGVISPLVHEGCLSLAMHPSRDIIYVGTLTGISAFDFSPPPQTPTDLTAVYLYPNPVYGRKGHNQLRIENITGPVEVEVYNAEGQLVASANVSQPGAVVWDLLTSDGFVAASGTYLVRIRAESGSVVKQIAVIR